MVTFYHVLLDHAIFHCLHGHVNNDKFEKYPLWYEKIHSIKSQLLKENRETIVEIAFFKEL